MRRLLYIPIIHDEADMGSVGTPLAQASTALAGDRRWALHLRTARKFWRSVGDFLRSFDAAQMRLYQDGLPVDGEMGRRIVEAAAQKGSRNYQLVRELLDRGATLQRTEDPTLLLQEHQLIASFLTKAASEVVGSPLYQERRDLLMEQRDRFITQTINATLADQELGVLFIGAQHQVWKGLETDVAVEMVKDPRTVEAYLQELLTGRDMRQLVGLARSVGSPAERR